MLSRIVVPQCTTKCFWSVWNCYFPSDTAAAWFPIELISRSLRLISIELRNRLDSFSHGAHFTRRCREREREKWSNGGQRGALTRALSASHSRVRSRTLCSFHPSHVCSANCRRCWRCARRPQTEYPGAAITGRLESVKDLVHQLIYQIGNRSEMEIDLILWKLPARNCPGDCAFSNGIASYKYAPTGWNQSVCWQCTISSLPRADSKKLFSARFAWFLIVALGSGKRRRRHINFRCCHFLCFNYSSPTLTQPHAWMAKLSSGHIWQAIKMMSGEQLKMKRDTVRS
jgi:hypothetical protein